jgi:hypothetical protein
MNPRMRIRHLVLYSAVTLTVLVPPIRVPATDRTFVVGMAMVGAPYLPAGVSWLIHRPG